MKLVELTVLIQISTVRVSRQLSACPSLSEFDYLMTWFVHGVLRKFFEHFECVILGMQAVNFRNSGTITKGDHLVKKGISISPNRNPSGTPVMRYENDTPVSDKGPSIGSVQTKSLVAPASFRFYCFHSSHL